MRYEMTIRGMTCGHCQSRVIKALQEISGVLAAEVNLDQGTAWVDAIDGVSPETMCEAVEDQGYPITKIEKKHKNTLSE